MKRQNAALLATAIAALASSTRGGRVLMDVELPATGPTPDQTKRWREQRGYPRTGTGKRQGERVARQVARSFGDPFAASNRCIERIKERIKARVV